MQHNEFEGQAGAPGADAGTGTTAPGAAPDAGSEGAAGDSLEVRLAAAEAKSAEHYDLYVRAVADMENVRRRAQEDVQKLTDRFVAEIDKVLHAKEADLMAV